MSAQQTDFLLQPFYQSYHVGGQFINEGHLRLFGIQQQLPFYKEKACFVDIYADSASHADIQLIDPDSINSFTVSQFTYLPFRNGSTMMVFDQQDCDYAPAGEVSMLLSSGVRAWKLALDHEYFVEDIKILSPSVVGIFFNGDTLYVDRAGNIVPFNPGFAYDHVLETDEGYIAANEDTLFTLDADFIPVAHFLTAGKIIELQYVSYNVIMIKTEFQFYALDESGEIVDLPFMPNGYRMMVKTDSSYWGLRDLSVEQMDLILTPVDTFPLSTTAELEMLSGYSFGDELVFATRYRSNNKLGFVLFRENPEDMKLQLPNDIGITGLVTPDTINATWNPYGDLGGKDWSIDSVYVEVTNFSEETVTSFEIELRHRLGCFGCNPGPQVWLIDTVSILPHASLSIFLGKVDFECAADYADPPFCFVTSKPNHRADNIMSNNASCPTPYFNIITASHELLKNLFAIYPNPAIDQLTIHQIGETNAFFNGKLFDAAGGEILSFAVEDEFTIIGLEDVLPGFYMIQLTDYAGQSATRKLIIKQ